MTTYILFGLTVTIVAMCAAILYLLVRLCRRTDAQVAVVMAIAHVLATASISAAQMAATAVDAPRNVQ